MRTFIPPGYSKYNKEWAEDLRDQLRDFSSELITWPHWDTSESQPGWKEMEAKKIISRIGNESVNIIAKSIGTLIAMEVLREKATQINKLILCGIPLLDLDKGDFSYYSFLSKLNSNQIICFQNSDDHHGSFKEVEKFLKEINPEIQIVLKPSDNHEYPYLQDFRDFLKD